MLRNMDADMCPYQREIRAQFKNSTEWNNLNKYYSSLFDEMSTKWGIPWEKLDFTTAYDYVDNYYSTWYDYRDLKHEDLSEGSRKKV